MGSTDQLYLILYATGFRGTSAAVTCTVGTQTLTPVYAGAQPSFPGLDQINVVIPASVKAPGQIAVTCKANGQISNSVFIALQ
ncbi:MAG: hypothetical protein WDO18_03260 [Acidobacteriota bacterium]